MALDAKDGRGTMPVNPAETGPRARVLVVDDDPISRRVVGRMVAALGFWADLAESASSAQALAMRSRYALVLTDLQMSGMNGDALGTWIKNRWKRTPVCVMTSCRSEDVACFGGTDSVDCWLHKPFDMDQLRGMLADLVTAGEPEVAE